MKKIVKSEDCTSTSANYFLKQNYKTAIQDMARPRYHFCPPSGWMNDPNGGIFSEGKYHFFYLQDPFDSAGMSGAVLEDGTVIDGKEKPNRFWAHACTPDFFQWEYLPQALEPDRKNHEIKPISGSVIRRKDGSYFMAFTSVREEGNEQWGAISGDNMKSWVRLEDPLLPFPPFPIESDWRDPFLFEKDADTYLVVGAAYENRAMLLLYQAVNDTLLEWKYQGIFMESSRDKVYFFECPKIVTFQNKMAVVFSPFKQVLYNSGKMDENGRFCIEKEGKIDFGKVAYATINVTDEQGDIYFLSWAPGWFTDKKFQFQGWSGCMTFPRKVWLDKEGKLWQEPCRQLESRKKLLWEGPLENDIEIIPDSCLEPQIVFELNLEKNAGFKGSLEVVAEDGGEVLQTIEIGTETIKIDGEYLPANEKRTQLLGICDGFLWEYFIDNGSAVITSGTEKTEQKLKLRWKSNGCERIPASIQIWKVDSAQYTHTA